jgi:sulfide dehydrogenase cytochrome subunit
VRKILLLSVGAAGLLAASGGAVAADIKPLAETCNNCHGVDGVSAGHSMPSIAGLPVKYLTEVMIEWKKGERFSTTMGRLIKGYSDEQITDLAKHYAALPWKPVPQDLKAKWIKEGSFVVDRCSKCHGDTGAEPDDDETPRLDGQWAKYMELQLMAYRDKDVKLPHEKMRKTALKLSEEEVGYLNHYFASAPKATGKKKEEKKEEKKEAKTEEKK